MSNEPASNVGWIYDNPVYSDVEAKLRNFLVELGNDGKIYGIQICVYKDGEVIIDTAAGVLGQNDPRPVQPDTLFPVFSATKGVTAGMIHWLADKGRLKLDENVANIWPEFGANGKDKIKVNHILNHTSGLHNALHEFVEDRPSYCDWDKCLKRIETLAPETEPGSEQIYHYLSYGWLCGGVIEHASGKQFQEVLEESFVRPLKVEGELYIRLPPGVDSHRLATTSMDEDEVRKIDPDAHPEWPGVPSSFSLRMLKNLIALCNSHEVRCSTVPAAGGHFSARAVARYYAALLDGGVVPPPHPASSRPPLGSHPHHPNSPPKDDTTNLVGTKLFNTPKEKLNESFLGIGDFKDLILSDRMFGLGFNRISNTDGSFIGFGHAGLGGSTAFCDINNKLSIAVIVNKMTTGGLTAEIIRFIYSELDLPVPLEYASATSFDDKPKIN